MKRCMATALTVLALAATFTGCRKQEPQKAGPPPAAQPAATAAPSGEALFRQHCAVCHPDGGNIVKPEYTLHAKALAAHRIGKAADIVGRMRNPGPGMTRFDAATVSDAEATAIAEYILATFK